MSAAEQVGAGLPSSAGLAEEEIYCPECGYSLQGLASERCPECGLVLDFLGRAESTIPWVHRRKIGRVRAYLQTAWSVLFRTRVFCREVYRAVDEADARAFRRVSVKLAWLFLPALFITTLVWERAGPGLLEDPGIGFVAMVFACLWYSLALMARAPGDLLWSRVMPDEVQRRARVLLDYSSASLALMWMGPVVGGVAALFALPWRDWPAMVFVCFVMIAAPAALVAWFFTAFHMGRRALRERGPAMRMAALLPVALIATLGVVGVGVPFLVFGLIVVWHNVF